ncbi:MAG: LuxR C-terminal-related transcriptional regulator [Pseudomonadota bacterium]
MSEGRETTDIKSDDIRFGVDVRNTRAFERVFPDLLIDFMTEVNFTRDAEEVFQLLLRVGRPLGFTLIIYEYCHDIEDENARIFTRSNLPEAMIKLEKWIGRSPDAAYGRRHGREKWTPGVAGHAFSDMFHEHPLYQRKLRMAAFVPGVKSGFGVPLRSPNRSSRAGISFSGKLSREECTAVVTEHGAALTAIAWAAHTRILQHMSEEHLPQEPLTPRQLEYVRCLAEGLLDKEIAHKMDISYSGVRKHQEAVAAKLDVTRRTEIVAAAKRAGLWSEPEIALTVGPAGVWDVSVFQDFPKDQSEDR